MMRLHVYRALEEERERIAETLESYYAKLEDHKLAVLNAENKIADFSKRLGEMDDALRDERERK